MMACGNSLLQTTRRIAEYFARGVGEVCTVSKATLVRVIDVGFEFESTDNFSVEEGC
jgi:hypothetical protein